MTGSLVLGNRIFIKDYVDFDKATRVSFFAELPNDDYDSRRVYILDWKISADDKTISLRYQNSNNAYASIFETKLPLVVEESKLEKPSRSKFWKLFPTQRSWVNTKTGEAVYIS